MNIKIAKFRYGLRLAYLFLLACLMALTPVPVTAIGLQDPNQDASFGMEGTIEGPPPTTPASITTPSSGQTFTDTPITIAGVCKTGLLVKIFSNNVFVGSTMCQNGSYRLQIDLFSGRNDLVARVYDALDQAGPDSNLISVVFNDGSFAQFGTRVTLSSLYARKGGNPGSEFVWPVVISGGVGPYAVSVDWGDNTADTLLSRAFAGSMDLMHTYQEAGIYTVIVKVSDANGTTAYLQLVGVANGEASGQATSSGGTATIVRDTAFGRYGWIIALAAVPLLAITFWLGQRHELLTIRRRIDEGRRQAGV